MRNNNIAIFLALIALCFALVQPCHADNWRDDGYGIIFVPPDDPIVTLLPVAEPTQRDGSYSTGAATAPSVSVWSTHADASAYVWVKYYRYYTYLNQNQVPLYGYVSAHIGGNYSGSGYATSSASWPWNSALTNQTPANYSQNASWGPHQYNAGSDVRVFMTLSALADDASADAAASATASAVWDGQPGGGGS